MDRRTFLSALGGIVVADGAHAANATDAVMKTRNIPSSGEAVPVIGLGTWQTFDLQSSQTDDLGKARDVLQRFYAGGGRLVDSSPMYGASEGVVGTLAKELGLAGKLFLATKVWTSGKDSGVRQMNQSFQLMQTKRIDLMQVHNLLDTETHLATMTAWKREGRIRYLGLTHYHAGAHAELERALKKHKPDFVQINYSPVERDADKRVLPAAADLGIAVIVNRPFAMGALFEKTRGKPLPPLAVEVGATSWAQFALKAILAQPAVTCAIPATRNPKHIEDNVAAGHTPLPSAQQHAALMGVFDKL